MCLGGFVAHLRAGAHRDPKRVMDPLELELQAFVTYLLLETRLGPSKEQYTVLNVELSLQPKFQLFSTSMDLVDHVLVPKTIILLYFLNKVTSDPKL